MKCAETGNFVSAVSSSLSARLIAGGRLDTLFFSVDDGRSFKVLKYPSKEQRDFACAGGAAYLSAPFQQLVRVT